MISKLGPFVAFAIGFAAASLSSGCSSTETSGAELRRRYEDFAGASDDERTFHQVLARFDGKSAISPAQALSLEDVLLDLLQRHPCHLGVLRVLQDVRRKGELPHALLDDLELAGCSPAVSFYLFARGTDDVEAARKTLELALGVDPDFPHARALRGQLELEAADARLGRAVRDLEAAQRAFPENQELLLALAEAHERRLDPAGALAIYRELLVREPANRDVRMNLGLALLALGEWRDAEEEFRRVQLEEPTRADAWHARGAAFVEGGAVREAEKLYREMLERFPEDPEVHFSLGCLYFDGPLHDRRAARRQYREFLDQLEASDASSPNHRAALTYLADLERDGGPR